MDMRAIVIINVFVKYWPTFVKFFEEIAEAKKAFEPQK